MRGWRRVVHGLVSSIVGLAATGAPASAADRVWFPCAGVVVTERTVDGPRPARVLVIGAGRMHEPPGRRVTLVEGHPSMAQIAGHALSNIFLDALAVDVARPAAAGTGSC